MEDRRRETRDGTGYGRQETGEERKKMVDGRRDWRRETRDGRLEMGQDTGDRRREKRDRRW